MERFRDPSNRLFELARSGRRMTRWWAVPLLLLLFSLAGAVGFLLFELESAEEAGLWNSALTSSAYFIASYLPVALLVGAWVWLRERRGVATLGFNRPDALRSAMVGFLFGTILMSAGVLLIVTTGDATVEFERSQTLGWIALAPGLVVLVGWIVQGATEELMFRGWLLQNAGAQIGPLPAILFTTLFFAIGHLGNPGVTQLAALNLTLIGILFVLLALYEGGIWAACGFHIAWNWVQSSIFGFKVSGLDIGGGSLLTVSADGSDTLLGGDFGFEGSVAATTAIIIGIVLVFGLAAQGRE